MFARQLLGVLRQRLANLLCQFWALTFACSSTLNLLLCKRKKERLEVGLGTANSCNVVNA